MAESANENDDDQNGENTDDEESYVAPSDYHVPDTICVLRKVVMIHFILFIYLFIYIYIYIYLYIYISSIAEIDMMDHPDYGHVVRKDEEYVWLLP